MISIFKNFFSRKNKYSVAELDFNLLPKHLAIIMDGNGRWAKKRSLPRSFGHKQGSENLREIVRAAGNIGIKMLTVYAFSTENWKRPAEEIEYLMLLLTQYLDNELPELEKNNVRLRFIGDTSIFSETIKEKIAYDVNYLSKNEGMIFNIALNYGGRDEIVRATKKIVSLVAEGALSVDDIDERIFGEATYTPDFPEVDLLIRTSSDYRVSNFLLWQIAYAEMIFVDIFWPDFVPQRMMEAISEFQNRNRRFGGL
ncbi:MAG: isoprenyl transferase [Negativicutes bacterium]|jgi:undecaprenyl diphosphate synthase